MRKKKNYLLLELLIAFSILSLCAVPLVRNPLAALRNEISSLERMELERVAELSFASLKAELHQQNIPWESLIKKGQSEEPDLTEKISLCLEGISERTFEKKVFFWTLKSKEGANQEEHRLVRVKIAFVPSGAKKKNSAIPFEYDLFLSREKMSLEPKSSPPA